MANSTTRRYISVDLQNKESNEEIHLTNSANQISGQISIINPKTQKLENIANIFFNKEDGQQIAESIKNEVKDEIVDELKDDYITVESAESRFISTSQADDFALKSELAGLASKTELQSYLTIESANSNFIPVSQAENYALKSEVSNLASKTELQQMKGTIEDEIGETYVTKTEAQDFATKSDLSNLATVQSLQQLQQQVEDNYIPKSDEGKFIPKSRIQEIAPIDTSEPYTLEDVVGKLNELISAIKGNQ